MHDWLGEVIVQPLIQTPDGLFLNLILSETKHINLNVLQNDTNTTKPWTSRIPEG